MCALVTGVQTCALPICSACNSRTSNLSGLPEAAGYFLGMVCMRSDRRSSSSIASSRSRTVIFRFCRSCSLRTPSKVVLLQSTCCSLSLIGIILLQQAQMFDVIEVARPSCSELHADDRRNGDEPLNDAGQHSAPERKRAE